MKNRLLIIDSAGGWHYVYEDAITDIVFPNGHRGQSAWVFVARREYAIEVLPGMVEDLAEWAAQRTHDFGIRRPAA